MQLHVRTRHMDVRIGQKTKHKFKITSEQAAYELRTERFNPSQVSYESRWALHLFGWSSTVGQTIRIRSLDQRIKKLD
jgi:hypothetical protein